MLLKRKSSVKSRKKIWGYRTLFSRKLTKIGQNAFFSATACVVNCVYGYFGAYQRDGIHARSDAGSAFVYAYGHKKGIVCLRMRKVFTVKKKKIGLPKKCQLSGVLYLGRPLHTSIKITTGLVYHVSSMLLIQIFLFDIGDGWGGGVEMEVSLLQINQPNDVSIIGTINDVDYNRLNEALKFLV